MMNLTDVYDSFINCKDIGNEDNNLILNCLLLSSRSSVFLLSLIGLIIYKTLKPLGTNR